MPSTEELLAQAALSLGEETAALQAFKGQHHAALNAKKAEVDAKKAELDTWRDNARGEYPTINLFPDSGRFLGDAGRTVSSSALSFVAPNYLVPYNGGSAFVEAGRFTSNNSTAGGQSAALEQSVIDLYEDMGLAVSRYGSEFCVAETTSGSTTASPHTAGNGTHLAVLVPWATPPKFTFSGYARFLGGDGAFHTQSKVDGDAAYAGELIDDSKWHHFVHHYSRGHLGYLSGTPIYSAPNTQVQVACLALMPGHVSQNPQHIAPTISSW